MKELRETLYYILHYVTGCSEKDMDKRFDSRWTCTKCGRHHFIFRSFKN